MLWFSLSNLRDFFSLSLSRSLPRTAEIWLFIFECQGGYLHRPKPKESKWIFPLIIVNITKCLLRTYYLYKTMYAFVNVFKYYPINVCALYLYISGASWACYVSIDHNMFIQVVIADESHFLKNAQAKRTSASLPILQVFCLALVLFMFLFPPRAFINTISVIIKLTFYHFRKLDM